MVITLRLPVELVEQLDILAAADGRSRNSMAIRVLLAGIKEMKNATEKG